MSSSSLKVIFNGITGLAHWPMAHTCNSTIEISVDTLHLMNYFFKEIMAVYLIRSIHGVWTFIKLLILWFQ